MPTSLNSAPKPTANGLRRLMALKVHRMKKNTWAGEEFFIPVFELPKPPATAFALFKVEQYEVCPDLKQLTSLGSIRKQWWMLGKELRKPYEDKAERDQGRYEEEYVMFIASLSESNQVIWTTSVR